MRNRLAGLALVTAVGLTAAACGSSGSQPMSKAQAGKVFLAAANASNAAGRVANTKINALQGIPTGAQAYQAFSGYRASLNSFISTLSDHDWPKNAKADVLTLKSDALQVAKSLDTLKTLTGKTALNSWSENFIGLAKAAKSQDNKVRTELGLPAADGSS